MQSPPPIRKFNINAVKAPRVLEKPLKDGKPLDLEIGCGVGLHPIRYAQANPERRLIAIEHTREKFESFTGRLARHETLDIQPVHADAVRWVTHALENESIDRVFLLYPNPEPKASNKRWFRMPFFEELLKKVKSGGTIELATNIKAYADEAKIYATQIWRLETLSESNPTFGRTHFEKKYLERGETCFDVVFRKP